MDVKGFLRGDSGERTLNAPCHNLGEAKKLFLTLFSCSSRITSGEISPGEVEHLAVIYLSSPTVSTKGLDRDKKTSLCEILFTFFIFFW